MLHGCATRDFLLSKQNAVSAVRRFDTQGNTYCALCCF